MELYKMRSLSMRTDGVQPRRRHWVARAFAGVLGLAALTTSLVTTPPAASAKTLTAVLEAEIVTLDPHFTGAYISRTFGLMVYDTLFAPDSQFNYRPQMVDTYEVSPDKLTWKFTLRDGLQFHDGTPVTSNDVVASLRRWATRSAFGGRLIETTASLDAADPKTFVLVLKEPYGLVLETLGAQVGPPPFIIPERLAKTPGTERITEIVGSGPFIFSKADHKPGDRMLLRRNPTYVPRQEPPDFLSGGKVVKIDALEIRVISDASTTATALQAGEIDYMQYAPFDLLAQFEKSKNLTLLNFKDQQMFTGHYRLNHAAPPLDDPEIRRVLLQLVDQKEVMQGFGLNETYARTCNAFFTCGGSNENFTGAEILAKPSIEAAREALKKTKYKNEPVILMIASDLEAARVSTEILADRMRRAGFNVDAQIMDWASVLARRTQRTRWHVYGVHALNFDLNSPLTNSVVNFNCKDTGLAGFMCMEPVTDLFAKYAKAADPAARHAIASEIQSFVYGQGAAVPWGQFAQPAAYRASLKGVLPYAIPIFWNVEKP